MLQHLFAFRRFSKMALRWGIAGVEKISHDYFVALNTNFTVGKHLVVAIAANDKESFKAFVKIHPVKTIHGNFEELARNSKVDVVLVAVPIEFRYDVALTMLKHGKHILCVQPIAADFWQTKQLLNFAKSKNLFIIEGLWSRFFPAYNRLRSLIWERGDMVKEISIHHGLSDDCNEIEFGEDVFDHIAIYAIQFMSFLFGCEQAKSITAYGTSDEKNCCQSLRVRLLYSGDRCVNIICSTNVVLKNQATITTKKGTLCIPNYWCPTSLWNFNIEEEEWPLPLQQSHIMNFKNSFGLRYLADEVQRCLRLGKITSDILPSNEILTIAYIKSEIRRQILNNN